LWTNVHAGYTDLTVLRGLVGRQKAARQYRARAGRACASLVQLALRLEAETGTAARVRQGGQRVRLPSISVRKEMPLLSQ